MIRILSLGGGVQSSTVFLMACHGEIEKPELAIFADTGWERRATYDWIEFLSQRGREAGIPLVVIGNSNIRHNALHRLDAKNRPRAFIDLPVFAKHDGKISQIKRQCTTDYKIYPVRAYIREYLRGKGIHWPRPRTVELLMGISYDEILRMKDSRVKYIVHSYPLIDKRMSRQDCVDWMQAHGYQPPVKSSCIGCPYHDKRYWENLRLESPEEFADAVEFDRQIRHLYPRIEGELYIHRSGLPLDVAVAQSAPADPDGDCDGMCAV